MPTNVNFVNSVMSDVKLKLADLFPSRNGISPIANRSKGEALRAILSRQRIQTLPVYEGGRCVGHKVVFLKGCSTTQSGCFDFTLPANSGCDLPVGTSLTSEVITLGEDCHIVRSFNINDNLCDNEYTATELVAESFRNAMNSMVGEANQKFYKDLVAKRMPNKLPLHIANTWTDGTQLTTDVPSAFWTADMLVQLGLAGEYNGIEDYMILDGGNLKVPSILAQYHGLNSDEKHQPALFQDYPVIFDNLRDITSATTRNSTFLVDTGGLAVMTRHLFESASPQNLVDPRRGRYEYHLPLAGIQGANVDVKYEKVCQGTDAQGRDIYLHKFMLIFRMQTVFAPAGCDSETGVLEFVNVA
jgi:hypothetical protein